MAKVSAYQVAVIGGGVIGTACARAAALRQLHTVIGLRDSLNEQAARDFARDDLRAFAVGIRAIVRFDRQRDIAAVARMVRQEHELEARLRARRQQFVEQVLWHSAQNAG